MRNVKAGVIDATSQQYPLLMASLGVAAVVKYAKTGKKASGLHGHGREPHRRQGRAGRPLEERRLRPRQLLGLVEPFLAATGASPSCAPVATAPDST